MTDRAARIPLPIDDAMPDILQRLTSQSALVVVAAPGAGKTTRMPPAIYQSGVLPASSNGLIVLQPRRIAVRTVAARIADENGWRLGDTVGYQVRMENCTSPRTRITIMTEGILTRRMQSDPALDGIGAVMLDEFHMRTIHVDQSLAMLVDVRANLRPDLKLIISSATINPQPICDFLPASCVQVPGRTYPVEIQYEPLVGRSIEAACRAALERGMQKALPGHALVFLPGVYEINKVQRHLAPFAAQWGMLLLPLHGSLPLSDQAAAIAPSSTKKIILATNAAETSITVDGVTLVVDSGQARQASYDAHRGINRLITRRISQAAAGQRAGRAGRTAEGLCIRLWDSAEWKHQPPDDPPEITLVELANLCIDVYRWNPAGFNALAWLTPPPATRAESAKKLLRDLGAAEGDAGNFQLTPLGHRMAELPLHPRLSRIVLAGIDSGHAAWGMMAAAILSDSSAGKSFRPDASAWNIYSQLEGIAQHVALSRTTKMNRAAPDLPAIVLFRQLTRLCRQPDELPPLPAEEVIAGLLLTGFPDRVCMMDSAAGFKGVMVGGTGVQLADRRLRDASEFLIALDIQKNDDRENLAAIHLAARLSMATLLQSKLPSLKIQKALAWDDKARRFVAMVETRLADLRLKSYRDTDPDLSAARSLARRVLQPICAQMLRSDPELSAFCERMKLLGQCSGEAKVPTITADLVADLLADFMCGGELRPIPPESQVMEMLLAAIPYSVRRELDTLCPAFITLASGKKVAIQYAPDGPVLEARVADLLGTLESPRIGHGRVPVKCRILGPNFRPVQVTADLAGFWRGSYQQIRRDLRARYPRHPWPDDPLTYVPARRD